MERESDSETTGYEPLKIDGCLSMPLHLSQFHDLVPAYITNPMHFNYKAFTDGNNHTVDFEGSLTSDIKRLRD